jgi:protein-S-isoprenylcysteine O-methyltransferase Ste14
MKRRVQIDSAILSFIIILTGFLYQFPHFYSKNILWDDVMDFIGLSLVLNGTYLRMGARGLKKANSNSGQSLVTVGLYTLVRNPMYLGSFLIGAGFILIVWPWWALPIFGYLFYLRFNKEMVSEEMRLSEVFGEEYKRYTKKVPRFLPRFKDILRAKIKEIFPLEQTWSTKERWGLLGWPLMAVFLEAFQEGIVFGFVSIGKISYIFMLSIVVFTAVMWLEYKSA